MVMLKLDVDDYCDNLQKHNNMTNLAIAWIVDTSCSSLFMALQLIFFPADAMASPFIIEPSNTLVTRENATKSLVWVIESCVWEVRIVTENYTLYPIFDPKRVPIKLNTDYNVSVAPEVHLCEDSAMNTNVSLSINFNSNVLGYVEYLICKVYNSTYDVR